MAGELLERSLGLLRRLLCFGLSPRGRKLLCQAELHSPQLFVVSGNTAIFTCERVEQRAGFLQIRDRVWWLACVALYRKYSIRTGQFDTILRALGEFLD